MRENWVRTVMLLAEVTQLKLCSNARYKHVLTERETRNCETHFGDC
jgi:hypothetical protein